VTHFSSGEFNSWLDNYKNDNIALLDAEPEFRRWLDKEYAPIGGGWQY
jgi:hypothetical protein